MTPIFELSSKLFPSSDVRGCENRRNQVLHSGPILHFDDDGTKEDRKQWEGGREGAGEATGKRHDDDGADRTRRDVEVEGGVFKRGRELSDERPTDRPITISASVRLLMSR